MKILCRISGFEFYSSHHFNKDGQFTDTHPIFSLPVRSLLAKARKFGKGEYDKEEETLLFLALLNSTKAVTFDCPAIPGDDTVLRYIEPLFELLTWYEKINSYGLQLPQLRVTHHNQDLRNIGIFISSWYEVRKEWMIPSAKKILEDILDVRVARMQKLINSQRDTTAYSARLADWAMKAAKVYPQDIERYTELFKMKPDNSVLSCDLDDLLDLQDWMLTNLYGSEGVGHSAGINGDIASKVVQHIDRLVKIRQGGMIALLGETLDGPSQSFKIKLDSLPADDNISREYMQAQLVHKLAALDSPNYEPKRADYPNNLKGYLQARLRWMEKETIEAQLGYFQTTIKDII